MISHDIDQKIITRGEEFFASIAGETPSLFSKNMWVGKVMDWCMRREDFKVQMFRFVDVFPSLNDSRSLVRHIEEYFGSGDDVPAFLKLGAKGAKFGGALGAKALSMAIRANIENMAKQFIVGETPEQAVKTIAKLRKQGFAVVLDLLGEATVSEPEADLYVKQYLDMLDGLTAEKGRWSPLGESETGDLDWGHAPQVNVSVKPSAFYSQAKPMDMEGSVQAILDRLTPIYRKVCELGGFLCIDMESYKHKAITLEVFRRLRACDEFRDYPHLGIVLQSYLRDTDQDLDDLLAWSRGEGLPISIRLVKGAYWDYETILADQNGWEPVVYQHKPETDAAFERQTVRILENHDLCHFACASHNVRSIATVMEMAAELGVPDEHYEFQILYGMAEPVRKGLLNVAKRVRLYSPFGQMLPGMAYLVRRLLENTANESFLRQSFNEHVDTSRLLEDPLVTLEREKAEAVQPDADEFLNDPVADYTQPGERDAYPRAIANVRERMGQTLPLVIGGKTIVTDDVIPSVNPANPDEVIAHVCQAGVDEVAEAIAAAKAAFPEWRDTPAPRRAAYLRKAAAIARRRIHELCAWQILEVGKQWDQAHADITETIDFFDYYADEMERLDTPRKMGNRLGEDNRYFYQPKGVAAIIAPWNFPLAISGGMAAAAIVAGNPVVFKPSGVSSAIGFNLQEIFAEAGLPDGVFNFCPGRGRVMGDFLVEHPDISVIAFTGSMEVGLRILERAGKVAPGQPSVKHVVCEMGGKNAIIIDDDADLDEAVPHVLYSAFGFQGQKCSACSRVIVHASVYERFIARLVEGAQALKVGPSEDPANAMGPVVDASAQKTILEFIEMGKQEGRLLYESPTPDDGYYCPIIIIDGLTPDHHLTQEEIFGPVLSVMKAEDFTQALEWANSTKFALTGGVFSRSPANLERARREFRVGNLYLNRNNVGALVGRQPFGGFKMSGVGTKAGGPDYLLHFMDPRTVTENTMRRGFAPMER